MVLWVERKNKIFSSRNSIGSNTKNVCVPFFCRCVHNIFSLEIENHSWLWFFDLDHLDDDDGIFDFNDLNHFVMIETSIIIDRRFNLMIEGYHYEKRFSEWENYEQMNERRFLKIERIPSLMMIASNDECLRLWNTLKTLFRSISFSFFNSIVTFF